MVEAVPAARIRVRGLVQGVGFRPYVWHLARTLGLRGWVRNDGSGVEIAVAGPHLPEFLARLPQEAPRLARIDAVEPQAMMQSEALPESFAILDSASGAVHTAIGPDAATCPECLAELCDPASRRWRYAFTTCTHCGPRYTVSRGIPYDRAQTSLADFPLCPTCAGEYTDPADRRFHAETTCCPDCGPRLRLRSAEGLAVVGDPIAATLAALQAGAIVAIKGLGGFHLACDARQPATVARLRQRKQREAKPLAVMGLNAASLAEVAQLDAAALQLLGSPAAPIVLCPKGRLELAEVAPGLPWLGVMWPATPLHWLLWHEAAGRPAGPDWYAAAHPLLLVMTSANPHGEPLVIDNDEALIRLAGIADYVLDHDRDIVVRCDDSVLQAAPEGPLFLRRARGYTPLPVPLASDGPPVLALGGYLKNTLCLLKGRQALLSQHIGGLDNPAAMAFQEEVLQHLLAVLEVQPAAVAHDLHPDFASTRLALQLAERWQVPAVAVGHHHAHIAAVLAEHGYGGPAIGMAIDGIGLGPDGGAWGGELLRVDGAACVRLGHLTPLPLPGGDQAARAPWRMAAAALQQCGQGAAIPAIPAIPDFLARHHPAVPAADAARLAQLLAAGRLCPPTTSLGRVFDAAAGLLGVRSFTHYEGQAAMELEGLAWQHGPLPAWPGGIRQCGAQLDCTPLFARLAELAARGAVGEGAALFHATLAAALGDWAAAACRENGIGVLAVGGGCAMNRVLMQGLAEAVQGWGIRLLTARALPPNDGGLALGQAWVARQVLASPV